MAVFEYFPAFKPVVLQFGDEGIASSDGIMVARIAQKTEIREAMLHEIPRRHAPYALAVLIDDCKCGVEAGTENIDNWTIRPREHIRNVLVENTDDETFIFPQRRLGLQDLPVWKIELPVVARTRKRRYTLAY